MLQVEGIDVAYGPVPVLRGVSFAVQPGRITCLLGRNGAGKTTTMKAIMGILPLQAGRIMLDGVEVSRLPKHRVAQQGIGYVPQGRRLFADLTVAENLAVGLRTRASGAAVREEVLEIFPRLRERLDQPAQTLSGGEQQMLATARALCIRPKVLLLDEPTEGLQPSMIEAIRQVVVRMRAEGVAVLLVEQRVEAVLSVADDVVFLETGRVVETVPAEALRADPGRLLRRLGV
ncbi:ABC transporter ATP-binding protein [Acidimangrovimonas sediminis]|uniref:ABC transporter ATP-binding protein n=1 Tax=Acidimangrovimonas sediminis TaxID=2056283 RepID=UPI000C8055E5|nr:ABC transporter ATP-binding protein [Acidimangrovimonas sediminis]